jgi:hypothetical protein
VIYCRPGFERRYKKLTPQQRASVDDAVARFEKAVGRPHEHRGIGLRAFGRYLEFRAGLHLRVLALPQSGDFFLMCVGNHDEIRAYIRNKPQTVERLRELLRGKTLVIRR